MPQFENTWASSLCEPKGAGHGETQAGQVQQGKSGENILTNLCASGYQSVCLLVARLFRISYACNGS
jgi:hypothetical protein